MLNRDQPKALKLKLLWSWKQNCRKKVIDGFCAIKSCYWTNLFGLKVRTRWITLYKEKNPAVHTLCIQGLKRSTKYVDIGFWKCYKAVKKKLGVRWIRVRGRFRSRSRKAYSNEHTQAYSQRGTHSHQEAASMCGWGAGSVIWRSQVQV